MLIYTHTDSTIPQTTKIRPRFTYRYAFPDWLDDHYSRIVAAVEMYHHLDTNQLIRLTGYHERRVRRLLQMLERTHYLKVFARNTWRRSDGRRRSPVWGLLPRGALLRSIETSKPLSLFKTFEDAPPSVTLAEHVVDLADIRISFELHAQATGLAITTWRDEVELKRGQPIMVEEVSPRSSVAVTHAFRPDGFVIVNDALGHAGYFFLEADRTNHNNWTPKIKAYKALWSTGVFHKQFNVADLDAGFRVVVTTPTLTRAMYLKSQVEMIGRPDLASLFVFAVIHDVAETDNVFTAPIWNRGGIGDRQSLYVSSAALVAVLPLSTHLDLSELAKTPVVAFNDCLPGQSYQLAFGV